MADTLALAEHDGTDEPDTLDEIAAFSADDMAPFLKHGPTRRVSRNNGTKYKSQDGSTEAVIMAIRRPDSCFGCTKKLITGTDALCVPPGQPINPDKSWAIVCLDCAQKSVFDPVKISDLFSRSHDAEDADS